MVQQRDGLLFASLEAGEQDVTVAVVFALVPQPLHHHVKLFPSVQSVEVGAATQQFDQRRDDATGASAGSNGCGEVGGFAGHLDRDSPTNYALFDRNFLGLNRPTGSSVSFGGLVVFFVTRLTGPANVELPLVEGVLKVEEPIQAAVFVEPGC